MAEVNVNSWIPVEYSNDVIERPDILSAIESVARHEPMATQSKVIPRSGAAQVTVMGKGTQFAEDSGVNDTVTLSAVKLGLAFRIAEEDLNDATVDIVNIKKGEFARSYAKTLDNACLGTTGALNGATVPFTSLYKAIRTADTNTGYTANANYLATAGTGAAVTYDQLNALLALSENSEWFDSGTQVVIAHPTLKQVLRGIKDSQGHPIFVPGTYGQPQTATPDTLFGLPIKFTLGARTSSTIVAAPTGNPLIFVTNPAYLILGDRSGPEAMVDTSVALLTDETILAMRARKAFVCAVPNASAVLEILP